jgi:hypothetical protein
MDVAGVDEERLSALLTLLDDLDDVKEVTTNARGYESTGD